MKQDDRTPIEIKNDEICDFLKAVEKGKIVLPENVRKSEKNK